MIMSMYKICVTNRKLVNGDFITQLENVLDTDVSAVILREKDLTENDYEKLLKTVLPVCEKAHVPLIAHKYISAAIRNNIRYIHLPFSQFCELSDKFYKESEAKAGGNSGEYKSISDKDLENKLITGTSIHSVEDAIYAQKHGAAYITAGHIFVTDCKKGLEPRGLQFLKDVCSHVSIPVYAIGGIDESNMDMCIDAGAAGVCIMSGYMRKQF